MASKLMASISNPTPSPSPDSPLHLHQKLDLETICNLVKLVDHHIVDFLSDSVARKSLQLKCSAKLSIENHKYFEFSEHSVLSNLYWGIENIEVAIQSECLEETNHRLAESEKMLQLPALLEEDGSTAGVPNQYLVCCSYFYLSLVRKLRGDQWQMTMHFLQCFLVSAQWVRTELELDSWGCLFSSTTNRSSVEAMDEAARLQARRYKDWLMYYQVVSYGEAPSSVNGDLSLDQSDKEIQKRSRNFMSTGYSDSAKGEAFNKLESDDAKMVYQLELREFIKRENFTEMEDGRDPEKEFNGCSHPDIKEAFDMKRLQEMLEDSQSDSSGSFYSHIDPMEATDSEEQLHNEGSPAEALSANADVLTPKVDDRYSPDQSSSSEFNNRYTAEVPTYTNNHEANEVNASFLLSRKSQSSLDKLSLSIMSLRDVESHHFSKCYLEDWAPQAKSPTREIRCFSNFSSKFLKKCSIPELVQRGNFTKRRLNFSNVEKDWSEDSSSYEKDTHIEILGRFEKAVEMLCFSEGHGKHEDAGLEVTTVWEMLNNKSEVKCTSLKQVILHQLLEVISTSKRENLIRASVSTLLYLISEDKTIIEDIRKKDQHLRDFASALKKKIHEAAILIYLLHPSPSEIKSLELLPELLEVACNSNSHKEGSVTLPLTPTSASIAIIETLVMSFDYGTNNMHLALISSPQVIAKLVNVAMNKNLGEVVALAGILVRCMRTSGNCRKYLSQVPTLDPFLHLLKGNEKRGKFAALEYFHEILHIPRSSAIHLLHQIQKPEMINIMQALISCIKQDEIEHQLLAANLLLQLDMLGQTGRKNEYREEAIGVLLKAVASEENSSAQALSASILSNIGGTYAWTGEAYTAAWLVRKAGLTSINQRNMIRSVDWFDPCLQDNELDAWTGKVARGVIKIGNSVFSTLAKGIESKTRSVSHDCLITIAWLGSEMAINGPSNIRYSACEILLSKVAHFLHPGLELDERVLACLCVYNYTFGKGKQKLMNFSEGSRESLRRLSGITWMAEELLKVTDFFLPTKSRISCVHTQILEIGKVSNIASTALIFYKGHLCVGFSDGSIKAWDIKGQRATLVCEIKEHKRTVTSFTILGQGDQLLSGSSDKTVRVWQMVQKKLECIEVIVMKESVLKVDTLGDKILIITQKSGLKVHHPSKNIQMVCKNNHLKCLTVAQGRVYLGCADSSIKELDIKENHKTEIRAPTNSWRMLNKPINSVLVYKDWIYCAGSNVEGSSIKEWRRRSKPQLSIAMGRGKSVQAMAVVEDFIYLNCSSSPSIIQIWLRERQQKVSRLSAGSKITCLLTANDIVLCGTESGLIKGWIPL
ncbi:hypothetical protein J5N97_015272 [Dioscorea zingiberensis]|uniref:E3 ubiquitin-protein ligase LIN-1 n=1 Tax=Dioscorea zingiberensis TaxID=325984 RepID=A0A9D5CV18_9LILI|nr:hypothetical protein J5N97_015272 [Dioscorea zingiberensis]